MIAVGRDAKINIHWNLSPYDFSQDKIRTIQSKIADKYHIKRDQVKVFPEFKVLANGVDDVSFTHEIINNIQNPAFQISLFADFIKENNILNCDFEFIKKIDAEINSRINYEVYDKYKRYTLKWIKWSNFLSYGRDNYFDFSSLHGLILLNGEPANQSGKTTFAIDLLHFLLFGKTQKATTQDKIFNKHLPEETEVVVEGCLTIDGCDYIIKRTLNRPALSKRTARSKTTQKVEYYKIVGESVEELCDYVENQQGESSVQTNKSIKEAIGNEDDFDLIICATSSNLDDLIEKKETERGRLLNRWIGLLPLEVKDKIAREYFNTNVKRNFKSNIYKTQDLKEEIDAISIRNTTLYDQVNICLKENELIEKEYVSLDETKNILLEQVSKVDPDILKIDITTLQNKIDECVKLGKNKALEKNKAKDELDKLQDIDFSINQFNDLNTNKTDILCAIREQKAMISQNEAHIQALKNKEVCPTCGRKYDNIEHIAKNIESLHANIKQSEQEVLVLTSKLNRVNSVIESMSNNAEKFKIKSKLEALIPSLDVSISNLRLEYKDLVTTLNEYNKNKEIIDLNNQLEIKIMQIKSKILNNRNTKENNNNIISRCQSEIHHNTNKIREREELIKTIEQEIVDERNWRIYLDMVGKDGVSKMVLKKTLPILNVQISRLLSDVCDFGVEIEMTDKNEVMFYLIKDGVKSNLTSGSGFEKTAAALAIRSVLGNMSTLPKCNILVVDEILGRVAKENYDNMKSLYDKILENYDCIIQISHLEEIKDWHSVIVTVTKENNVSKITKLLK